MQEFKVQVSRFQL